jgi:hypothetical protein
MLFKHPRYRIMGDGALLVEVGDTIDLEVNDRVRRLFMAVKGRYGIRSWTPFPPTVPSFWSLIPSKPTQPNCKKQWTDCFVDWMI